MWRCTGQLYCRIATTRRQWRNGSSRSVSPVPAGTLRSREVAQAGTLSACADLQIGPVTQVPVLFTPCTTSDVVVEPGSPEVAASSSDGRTTSSVANAQPVLTVSPSTHPVHPDFVVVVIVSSLPRLVCSLACWIGQFLGRGSSDAVCIHACA